MRQPAQVIVFLFRVKAGGAEYAIFRRSDNGCWQSVAGGVEEGEDLFAAARREAREESGLRDQSPIYKLDMVSGVAKTFFAARDQWADDLYIVTKHFFAMDASRDPSAVVISAEHSEFRWVSYDDAFKTLRYDDDKTALWELDARLQDHRLPRDFA
jgi:dihydroneopterin triphosphate diphosphatase